MASLTQWTWVWANSGRWWRTGKPGGCNPWGRKESDTSEWLNNNWAILLYDSFKIYLLINFGCTGSSLLCGLFSSCGEQGAHFAVVHRLLIALSCCGAQALRHEGFRAVACGLSSCTSWALEHRLNSCGIWLSCSVTCQSSWIRDQTHVSCIVRQILYHRATREAPSI